MFYNLQFEIVCLIAKSPTQNLSHCSSDFFIYFLSLLHLKTIAFLSIFSIPFLHHNRTSRGLCHKTIYSCNKFCDIVSYYDSPLLDWTKHASLLRYEINYSHEKFYDTGPEVLFGYGYLGACIIKLFTALINSIVL